MGMGERDPLQTQRDLAPTVTAELSAAGFEDAHEIGRGGFGAVYRCMQPALDRTVAVKVLTSDLDEENRARFFREQRAMGRLTAHPNIVTVLQVGATNSGRPFIVMPYHSQDSLEVRIRGQGPLTLDETLRLGVKLAGAVETAHRLGILHRDVKPGNILFTDYGEPALTDFGIAHIAGGFETGTGTVTGSPAFTAPEVIKGEPPSPASDVYGLGATLFCAITGHAAFERSNGEQVVAQFLRITEQPVPDLRKQGVPDDVCAIIERAMSTHPPDRPNTAAEFGDALRRAQLRRGFPIDEMALNSEPGSARRDRDPAGSNLPSAGSGSGGPRSAPPPAVRGLKGNLPLELTSFVGRRSELTEAKRLLSVSRLVTLTGIGGVGKTRLALRVAASARRAFADGVCLVELGELRDELLLPEVVAAAVGLWDRFSRPAPAVLAEFLAARHLLLVLDNCEQVVDGVARLAATLLQMCPELRIIATSREPLGIGGETVLRVPPLTVPDPDRDPSLRGLSRYDAVTLFADRAQAVVPDFGLTNDNRVTVARICRRLDGLPLPIELAAARLPALSVEQILQRLTDRFTLLARGSRVAPTRQQTLRLCIDWSHELCSPLEQRVWGRLSVFAGGFELDAAEDICGQDLAPEEMLGAVASLVDKSILIREDAGSVVRFRLLETLCDYGRDKAQQTANYVELRRRHRDWYKQLARDAEADWISSRQLEWIARLEREVPNLREAMEFSLSEAGDTDTDAALQIAGSLLPFWQSRGLHSEGRRWLDRALAQHPGRPTAERIKALYTASALAEVLGDIPAGAALVEEGRGLAAQMADPVTDARIAHAEGLLALYRGDLPRACSRLEAALEVFGGRGDLALQVWVLMMLGLAYGLRGDSAQAIACLEKGLAITESRGESVYRSYSLWAMGVTAFRRGDRDGAVRFLEQGLRLTRLADAPLTAANCLEVLAWIACDQHGAHRAAVLMGATEALGAAVGRSPVVLPDLLVHHKECERSARRALGEQAFEAARRNGKALSAEQAVAYALREQPRATTSPAGHDTTLTKRERQVADLIAQGLTNKEIAAKLVISQSTAEGHVEHSLTKLGFTSRAQIAAWIVEQTHDELA